MSYGEINVFVIPLHIFAENWQSEIIATFVGEKAECWKMFKEGKPERWYFSHLTLPLTKLCPLSNKIQSNLSLTPLYVPFAAHAISDVIRVLH